MSVPAPDESGTSNGTLSGPGGSVSIPSSTPPSTPTTPALAEDAGHSGDCVATKVSWQSAGGMVAYRDVMRIEPCNTFSYRRTSYDGQDDAACTSELVQCSNGAPDPLLGTCHVDDLLRNPDVIAAFAKGGAVYGKDDRPCDGLLLQIDLGGKSVYVGGDCNGGEQGCGGTPCKPVPAGLRSLATVLTKLADQEKKRPALSCTK